MGFNTTSEGNFTIITLTGEIDLQTSPNVRELILQTLKNNQHILVEMAAVEYIDSSGIANLVEGFQDAKRRKLNFGLVNISGTTRQVLALARLDKIFPIFDSIDNAKSILNKESTS